MPDDSPLYIALGTATIYRMSRERIEIQCISCQAGDHLNCTGEVKTTIGKNAKLIVCVCDHDKD